MKKSELIKLVKNDLGCAKEVAEKAIESVLKNLNKDLVENGYTRVPYFGSFKLVTKEKRKMYSHLLKKEIEIPKTVQIKFKQSDTCLNK